MTGSQPNMFLHEILNLQKLLVSIFFFSVLKIWRNIWQCHSTYLPGWQLSKVGPAILPPITVHPVKHGSHPKVFPRQSILILPEDVWKEHNLSAHLVLEGNIDPMRSSVSPNPQGLLVNPKRRISCLTIFSTLYILEQGPWDVYRGHIEVFQGQFWVLSG